jgi:hypothetical protein
MGSVDLATVEQDLMSLPGGRAMLDEKASLLEAARFVRRIRSQAGLSQAGLAEAMGVAQARVAELEMAKSKRGPTITTLARAAKACGGTLKLDMK